MNVPMKIRLSSLLLTILFAFTIGILNAQEAEETKDKPVRNMFESNWLIDNQTAIVPIKGTFEFDILHRFGTWENGYDDFAGIFAPSNIRMGFTYVPKDRLQIGFGLTKEKMLVDFNAKYAVLKQTRKGKIPLSLTYFANMAVDSRDGINFEKSGDRLSYFHQLMLARKFSDKFSLQLALNFSHFNTVEAFLDDNEEVVNKMKNDHLSYSIMGRMKLSDVASIIFDVDQPITSHLEDDPYGNISFGFEFVTSSHAFQVFISNYKSIVPQYNNVFNQNDFGENEILLGFNMTRLWNF